MQIASFYNCVALVGTLCLSIDCDRPGECPWPSAQCIIFQCIIGLLGLSKGERRRNSALRRLVLCDAVFRNKPLCVMLCNFIYAALS